MGPVPYSGRHTMIASVHVADVGARSALAVLRRTPDPATTEGLRYANAGFAATLTGSRVPVPDVRRVALVAFWDDDEGLDRFLQRHPLAGRLAAGWRVLLEPLRAWGSWPGLPEGIPTPRTVEHDGPAAVLTLGRLRLSQAVRFRRTSARAEAQVVGATGLTWATGLARPPFVATCSLWESAEALRTYAYGQREPAHRDAIAADRTKPFHHQSAFVRFRPYASEGHLEGKNPLIETWMSSI
jgi:hypothetical protein